MPEKFRYALIYRPADLGTIPKGIQYEVEPRPNKDKPHHTWARHGVLVTQRELTIAEVRAFELAPIVDATNVEAIAVRIEADLTEYAAQYSEMSVQDPVEFKSNVQSAVERLDPGVRYSIFDSDHLASLVAKKLEVIADAQAQTAPRQK